MPKVTLKAVYTVGELAKMAGLSKRSLVSKLRSEGVRLRSPQRRGCPQLVTLSQLRKAWPDLWDSLLQIQRLQAEGEGGASET